jgi:DNA-binding NarL/FixJ family response regulator
MNADNDSLLLVENPASSPGAEGAGEPRNRRIRIVVADDSPVTLQYVCLFLRKHPQLEVVGTAADGVEAIRHVKATKPDLVLMDLEMPVLNGLEAARHLRARFPQTRIVITSLHDSASRQGLSHECGADEFLPKHELDGQLIPLIERLFAAELSGSQLQ